MITWIAKLTCDSYDCKEEGSAVVTLKAENVIDTSLPPGWQLEAEVGYDSRRDVNDPPPVPYYETFCPTHKR